MLVGAVLVVGTQTVPFWTVTSDEDEMVVSVKDLTKRCLGGFYFGMGYADRGKVNEDLNQNARICNPSYV